MKKLLLLLIFVAITSINAQTNQYLTDGFWGLDYLEDYVTVNDFFVETAERDYKENNYNVDRNVSASGEVKGNINLFRHILLGNQALDVTDYSFLNFIITNNEPVEIVIMQDEERDWKNRLRYTILTNSVEKTYAIDFSNFKDVEGNSVKITNIKTIVFSIIGDYTNYKPYNIAVNELSFSSQNILDVDNFSSIEKTKLVNYPNPFTNSTTIKLPNNSEYIKIDVYDLFGRIIDSKKIDSNNAMNTVQYNAPNLKTGMYKYILKDDKNKRYSGSFIIN